MRRSRRERIAVQQIVTFVQREVAPKFLQRAKAGEIELPVGRVGRDQFAQKANHFAGIVAHDLEKSFALDRIILDIAFDAILVRPVGNVFVDPLIFLPPASQKFPIRVWKTEGAVVET